MKIELSQANGETVVKVSGCLDTSASADFKRAVEGIPPGTKKVTFDFSEVDFIASSALRVMVGLGKILGGTAGRIAVKGANEVVRDVFDVTGLVEVFEML